MHQWDAMPGFAADDRIGGYLVERELGATPSGVLLQVAHRGLPRRAVIKVAHAHAARQVRREAYILEAIGDPGAPRVFESGELADRRPWFAFEPVAGVTLAELVARGPLPALGAAALVRDLAAILARAHRRGIAHGGLRPDRIVIAERREHPLCIPDWSDAGAPIDERDDVFALGVIARFALCGTRAVAALPADAPRELTHLIGQMLAPEAADRPASAEVRADLDWLVTMLATAPRRASPGAPGRAAPPPIPAAALRRAPANDDGSDEIATLRMRRLRWTAATTAIDSQHRCEVAGEIEVRR